MIWATARRRPVRPILLAGAQLAYVRYVHDAAQRAPVVRSRGLRVMLAGIAVLVTGAYAAMAVTSKRASTAAFWAVAAA